MISRLKGILIEKMPPIITIDVQGVGYEVNVSMQTFYALPALNEEIVLCTQLIVREDAHLLFGFMNQTERATFRLLLKVSGVGAKTALGILSALTSEELARAIATDDIKKLSSVPGIGPKSAERLILELRGKLAVSSDDLLLESGGLNNNNSDDVLNTLLALGYSEREAKQSIKGIASDIDVSEGVKLALKNLIK